MSKEIKIIKEYIERLELDLSGLTILTEQATGYYQWSPVIAKMAGADRVLCYNGKLLQNWIVGKDKIDIFLNLGHVRPINDELLSHANDKAVVAYMRESWEWRDGDVDKEACRKREIPIVGCNENFGGFNVFESCGQLLLKILFDAGQEIAGCKYLVVGDDDYFTNLTCSVLLDNNAACFTITSADEITNVDLESVDAIILADFNGHEFPLIGINPEIICFVWDGRMPKTLAYLGARPVIGLHCLGMKAAEVVYKGEQDGKYKDLVQVIT